MEEAEAKQDTETERNTKKIQRKTSCTSFWLIFSNIGLQSRAILVNTTENMSTPSEPNSSPQKCENAKIESAESAVGGSVAGFVRGSFRSFSRAFGRGAGKAFGGVSKSMSKSVVVKTVGGMSKTVGRTVGKTTAAAATHSRAYSGAGNTLVRSLSRVFSRSTVCHTLSVFLILTLLLSHPPFVFFCSPARWRAQYLA